MAFTVYLEHDGTETTLGTLNEFRSRGVQTFQVNRAVKECSIRIATTTDEEWLTVYEITADIDMRGEET